MKFWLCVGGVSVVGSVVFTIVFWKYWKSKSRMASAAAVGRIMAGKIAIITGASSGIGREVAFQLAKRRMEVILACRDRLKAQKAVDYIEQRLKSERASMPSSPHNDDDEPQERFGKLHVMDLDLADLRSIDSFAQQFDDRFGQLHLLVNNAGLMGSPYATSCGGLVELHFAVNHLGHFHLTNLLLPILKRSSPSRVLIVTSGYYRKLAPTMMANDFDESKLIARLTGAGNKPADYDPLIAYAFSKLANCLHAVELAKRCGPNDEHQQQQEDVQVFTIRPGFVRGTELGRHFNRVLTTLAAPLIWMFSQTVEQAAQTYLYCALTEQGAGLKSGSLYYNQAEQPYVKELVNEQYADVMWKLSERLVQMEKDALERI